MDFFSNISAIFVCIAGINALTIFSSILRWSANKKVDNKSLSCNCLLVFCNASKNSFFSLSSSELYLFKISATFLIASTEAFIGKTILLPLSTSLIDCKVSDICTNSLSNNAPSLITGSYK